MIFYKLSISFYFFIVRIASLWNPKAKLFINGRKKTWKVLNNYNQFSEENTYWFHCASLGEFEQARPLIEKFKQKDNKCCIVLTFFSPSGFEIRKNYEFADVIIYLPKDSKKNAKRFLDIVNPTRVFFIKYEFWANLLFELDERKIPTFLVSGVFRENQIFFKWYGKYMVNVLKTFDNIFLQNKKSQILLDTINVKSTVTGDTRFDRVMENAKSVKSFPLIENFIDNKPVLVIGSCWAEDEAIIFPVLNNVDNLKIIVAPHELGEDHFKSIESSLTKKAIRYSQLDNVKNLNKYDVLIVDNIGMLMHLYQYAKVAYIGGAFGKGLHNILEPASFGVPVIFGNKYGKFPEAFQFIDEEIGFSINNSIQFKEKLNDLLKNTAYQQKVLNFMSKEIGATEKIFTTIVK